MIFSKVAQNDVRSLKKIGSIFPYQRGGGFVCWIGLSALVYFRYIRYIRWVGWVQRANANTALASDVSWKFARACQ